MCFKKPKAPEASAEDLAAEEELKEMRKIRQAQLNAEISDSKQQRLEDAIALAQGGVGKRSLLKGGRGGSGFLGQNTRSATPIRGRSPSAPPIMGGGGGSGGGGAPSLFGYAGGSGGGGGSVYSSTGPATRASIV